jgi:hypothetical protein
MVVAFVVPSVALTGSTKRPAQHAAQHATATR